MSRRAINDVPSLGKVLGPYSRAVWAGEILYLSGQLGVDPATGKLVEGGVAAETEQLLKGLSTVLSVAGLGMGDVIKANVYLTDMNEFANMNKV
jgi:2-iminobutanoate/2-iminopropanoate deaminase